MLKGFTRKFKPLEILSEEELETIHRGALNVLETTGVRVEHDKALKLFADNDCKVDFEGKRVRIPPWLVEESLRKCPSSYRVKARDPKCDLMIGGNTVYFMQGMGMKYLDLDTWEPRAATVKEHRDAMIIADALDNLHMADGIFFYMDRAGIPAPMVMLENLASGIRNSTKVEHFGYELGCEKFAIKMANELGIGLDVELDSASPLTLFKDPVEAAFRYVEAGINIQPTSGAGMGADGPATFAAAVTLQDAELMAFITLAQLIRPGIGLSVQHGLGVTNMRTGNSRFGAVGESIAGAMTNQLFRRYRIPTVTTAGFTSDSKKIDFQCAYEKALGALISVISGGNLHVFHGGVHAELTWSPVQQVLDDDIAGWIGHLLEGVEVNDETLAIDLINEIGPIPGYYLNKEHTRKWWRKEQFIPRVADAEPYPLWMKEGKKDALALAKERVEEILATHKPKPLTAREEQIVEDVLKQAREYYKKEELISDEEWTVYMKTLESAD